jgi:hypothetical protein
VPAHTTPWESTATAPIDWGSWLSHAVAKVWPPSVDRQRPPEPVAM